MDLPIEIHQLILEHVDFPTQIRFRCVCRIFHAKLAVKDFLHIDKQYLKLLSDDILRSYPFVEKLDASDNPKITNINYLTKLKELNARDLCGIDDQGLRFATNLTMLTTSSNPNITNLNHMTKLIGLNAIGSSCGVGDAGISDLNLIGLSTTNNPQITSVKHMTKLKILFTRKGVCIPDHELNRLIAV